MSVEPASGDDVVNADEASSVTLDLSGIDSDAQKVELSIGGQTVTLEKDSDGDWSATGENAEAVNNITVSDGVPTAVEVDTTANGLGIEDGTVAVSTTVTDAAGNTASATTSFTKDTVVGENSDGTPMEAPVVTITDDLNNDGTINAAEKDGDLDYEIALPNGVEVGDTLNVVINDTQSNIEITQEMIDAGKYEGSTEMPQEGQSVEIKASITDKDGNTTESGSDSAQVDTTFGDVEEIKTLEITDIVDNAGDYSSVTMHGTGAIPGDTIQLFYHGGANASDAEFDSSQEPATVNGEVVTTTVNEDGTWSIDISNLDKTPVNDNEFFSVVEYDKDGNSIATDTTHYWHGTYGSAKTESADDFVLMGAGDDSVSLSNVNDANDHVMIDGGNGNDVAIFDGNFEDYSVTKDSNGNVIVTEKASTDSNNDGVGDINELRNIETIKFSNGDYNTATGEFNHDPVASDDNANKWVDGDASVTTKTVIIGTGENEESAEVSDWGEVNSEGKAVTIVDDLMVTTYVVEPDGTIGDLTAWNGPKAETGVGIGDDDRNGLSMGEKLVIELDGKHAREVEFTLDGLGGYFDESSEYATKVVITAYDENGNVIETQGGYRDSGTYSDTYSFVGNEPIAKFELTTEEGTGSYVVRNMKLGLIGHEEGHTEDDVITIDVLANDTDADNDSLSITKIDGQDIANGQAATIKDSDGNVLGSARVTSDGKIEFTPDESLQSLNDGDSKEISFEYSISDGKGGEDSANVSFDVLGVDEGVVLNYHNVGDDSTRYGGEGYVDHADREVITGNGDDVINIADDIENDSIIMTQGGNDTINVDDDFDQGKLYTGEGDDTVIIHDDLGEYSSSNTAHIFTGDGNDMISIEGKVNNASSIDSGAGDDTVKLNDVSSSFDDGSVQLGAGDDTLILNDNLDGSDSTIDGGTGNDILVLNADSINLDNIKNIEEITLGDGAQEITLSAKDVLEITDSNNTLVIHGDENDTVHLKDESSDSQSDKWEKLDDIVQIDGENYAQYSDGSATLLIQNNIIVDES